MTEASPERMNQGTEDLLRRAVDWLETDAEVAIATVIATWGSSPRPAGSHMVVRGDGDFAGSVSGGCIEAAVVEAAMRVIDTRKPADLEFGISDETAWSVGLSCGGRVRVRVEAMRPNQETWVALCGRLSERIPCLLLNSLGKQRPNLLAVEDLVRLDLPVRIRETAECTVRRGNSLLVEGELFLRPYLPPVRMLIVGAVHISQYLAPMAAACEIDVTIIDPRRAFAADSRFSSQRVIRRWPAEALAELAPDEHTALVALSHDPKIDDPALLAGLRSPAFYVGALGSRRSHDRRCRRLSGQGGNVPDLARIRAPIGLDIGACGPAEIAAAILAEVIAARRGRLNSRELQDCGHP